MVQVYQTLVFHATNDREVIFESGSEAEHIIFV